MVRDVGHEVEMGRLVDAILGLNGAAAYALVALLVFGEAAAFVGLLLPGEIAALLGGVVVSGGNASLGVMLVVASSAAVLGDSVGYEVGRHVGPRLAAWPPFERRFGARMAKASAYLQDRGGRAVLVGRWTSLLRALIPGLAGMARMPYGRFLAFNVVGGVAWATTFVLLGYVAGASWRRVERIAGRASLLLLVVVVVWLGVRWTTRRLAARPERVRAVIERAGRTRTVRWLAVRAAIPLAWLRERTTPGASRGLGWTLSVLTAAAAAWVAGVAIQDLFAHEELVLLDRPVAAWIAAHTTTAATSVADVTVRVLGPPAGSWLVALLALVAWRAGGRAAARVVVAAVVAAALAATLATLLPVSVAGTRFPAVSVAWLAAAVVAALPILGADDLRGAIIVAGLGAGVLTVAGLAEMVAGDATLSGVIGAIGIGAMIGAGGEVTARAVARPAEVREPPMTADPRPGGTRDP